MINFVFVRLAEHVDPAHFQDHLAQHGIKIKYQEDGTIKFYTHHYIRGPQVESTIEALKAYQ